MPLVMVTDFGKDKEGVYTWRVNSAHKSDLELIIQEALKVGYCFWEQPIIERSYKSWSVLLKLFIPYDMDDIERNKYKGLRGI